MNNKKLPYGQSNFADIIESGYAYVDKTRYVELLENEANRYQFLLRPRRFGKSLFLSVLDNYYDLNGKGKFEALFGNLYIGKHPTLEQGSYAVMKFDFSVVKTDSVDTFYTSFSNEVQEGVCRFFERYKNIFAKSDDEVQYIKENKLGTDALSVAYRFAAGVGVKILVIVDEYDNFANDLIAMGEVYKNAVISDGIVRTFYKTLKAGTTTVVRRIFITGVSPMMINDLTSGFNIATDLSLRPYLNEMFGFTKDEVEWLIDVAGIDRKLITVDMEYYYNGYIFDNDGKDKVYNSQMVLFLFDQIFSLKASPKDIVDNNLKTDYSRLQRLSENENNRVKLIDIIRDGYIYGNISTSFSIGDLTNDEHFVSLLFYMGLLTCGGTYLGKTRLKIPNYSIKTLYWEYMGYYIQNTTQKPIRAPELEESICKMALHGDIVPYLDFFTKDILERLSNRDLQRFDEKYIKAAMLSTLFLNNFYLPISEDENTGGYADVYLQKSPTIPEIKYEYVFEIKYIKLNTDKNRKKSAAVIAKEKETKFAEAIEQIEKYKKDKRFAGRSDIRFVAIVFVGKGKYEMREVASEK